MTRRVSAANAHNASHVGQAVANGCVPVTLPYHRSQAVTAVAPQRAATSPKPGDEIHMPRDALRHSRPARVPPSARALHAGSAEIGPWGFDLSGMNVRVSPGHSFYEYANGTWLKREVIPQDRTSWSTFTELRCRTEERVKRLVQQSPPAAAAGTNTQKIRDFYRAFNDTRAIEARGLAPAKQALGNIAAAQTHADVVRLMARADLGLLGPIKMQVTIDDKAPDRHVVSITQSGLGLPDRDYYLNKDPAAVGLMEAYREHIARVLALVKVHDPERAAQAVLRLETQIAARHWPATKRRERDLTYNLRSRAELVRAAHPFPLTVLLCGSGLGEHDAFVVAERDAVDKLLRLFCDVPVTSWRTYLTYHYVAAHAAVLPEALDRACFDFYGRALNGQQKPMARDTRSVAAVNDALGEAVGELYVAHHFPASHKQQTLRLVESVRTAFAARLRDLHWLSASTKQAAQRKLQAFVPKVGFPDKWRDYAALDVKPDDAFGNAVRARVWRWQSDLARLSVPTDRHEWSMTAQTVNASYDHAYNEIIFPAAILQPPFFDPHADPAVNYGAIGAVIGHEMGHGFDDQGAKSDEHGVLRSWWTPEDEQAFQKLVDKLVAQYDAYELFPGVHVNGRLTVGENIGDLGGLTLAYAAYRKSLGHTPAPVLDGFTGDQRFFLAWAQIWRQLRREESQRNLLVSDPHSPSRLRVDGVVRNVDAFYRAFRVQPGDPLWLDPRARVRIW